MERVELFFLLSSAIFMVVAGHGRLWHPPARSTLWRRGFRSPVNYDDNALYCGGFLRQHVQNGGKCGYCGDPWDGVRENEAGGKYANGIISRRYNPGQVIEIDIEITANHRGWFEFNICPVNNPSVGVTQRCLDQYPLQLADGSGVRYHLNSARNGHYKMRYRLPGGLQCTQCVLQWRYWTGNSWGVDADTGRGCIGCGTQEEFRGCADIAIGTAGKPPSARSTPTGTTTTTQSEATPRPGPTKIEGVRCRAIGTWEGNPNMDLWCNRNCNNRPPFCPVDRCSCRMQP